KQKTAYEITRRDWSSDVCSSDLLAVIQVVERLLRATQSGVLNRLRLPHHGRSEERRVGKECALVCRSRWSPYDLKKNNGTASSEKVRCAREAAITVLRGE